MTHIRTIGSIFGIILLFSANARAEPFILAVFHGGSLAGDDIRQLTQLRDVHFEPIDASSTIADRWLPVWALKPADQRLPWAVLLPPNGEPPPLWSGPLEWPALRAYLATIPTEAELIAPPHEAEELPLPHEIEDDGGFRAGGVLVIILIAMAGWRAWSRRRGT